MTFHETGSAEATARAIDDAVRPGLEARAGALLLDRSARGRLRLSGARAVELLTGLVTNDVGAHPPGTGCYACALSAKGKIVADLRIFVSDGELLIDSPERATPGWREMVRKYVNPRMAPYSDMSETLRHFTIFGTGAARIAAAVSGLPEHVLSGLPAYGHVPGSDAGVRVARSPELALDTFDLFVSSESAAQVWQQAIDAGARVDASDAWEVARVEAGRPEWGIDMDDQTLPQEANMDELQAISYTKGCYIGQEVVARIHFRGHVNRHLRGVIFSAERLPPRGAGLVAPDGKAVGDVRSGVDSPQFGRIALAMIRREIAAGEQLMVTHDGVEIPARVVPLPFTA